MSISQRVLWRGFRQWGYATEASSLAQGASSLGEAQPTQDEQADRMSVVPAVQLLPRPYSPLSSVLPFTSGPVTARQLGTASLAAGTRSSGQLPMSAGQLGTASLAVRAPNSATYAPISGGCEPGAWQRLGLQHSRALIASTGQNKVGVIGARSSNNLLALSSGPLCLFQSSPMPSHDQRRHFINMNSIQESFNNPRHKMSNTLMAAMAGVFVLTSLVPSITRSLTMMNAMVSYGGVHRILTATLVSGSIINLAFTLLGIHWVGKSLEESMGHNTFLAIYIASAVSTNVAFFMCYPLNSVNYGSSGCMIGLFGSYLTYNLVNRSVLGISLNSSMSIIMQIVALNVGLNLLLGGGMSFNITHICSFVGTSAFTYLVGPRYVYESGSIVNRPIIPWFR